MDDGIFFAIVKHTVFGGHISQEQVDGINRILDYGDTHWPALLRNQFANIFAQCTWETNRAMKPVTEAGGPRYLRAKPYWPWIGEGLIQVSWEANAKKFGAKQPGDLLQWPVALDALFRGMMTGMFTGKSLPEYCNAITTDFFHAREVVNVLDHAHEIAAISVSYLKAFEAAGYNPGVATVVINHT